MVRTPQGEEHRDPEGDEGSVYESCRRSTIHAAVIRACEKGKQPVKALRPLEGMQQKGLEPGMISYSMAISICKRGKRPVKALEILSTFLDASCKEGASGRIRLLAKAVGH